MSGRRFARSAALPVLLVAGGLAACDTLLEVEMPGQVPASALDDPGMIPTLVLGAVADFECAWAEYVLSTAAFTEELTVSSAHVTWNQMDPRTQSIETFNGGCATSQGTIAFGVYRPLHTARYQAEDVYRRVSELSPAPANAERYLAQMSAYAGYSYVLLGEAFCDRTIAVDGGPLLSRLELENEGIEWLSTAINHARNAGANDILNMATLGRARARLNAGDLTGALADAQAIPEDFTFNVTRSDHIPARHNRIFQAVNLNRHGSIQADFQGLTVGGVPDSRVPVALSGLMGGDGVTRHWTQTKYPSLSSPMPMATWREAQLIIAEIQGGQAAVAAINRLRAKAGLPLFASSDPAEIEAQVIEERRREQFLEGQWMNTKLRLGLQWEDGRNHKGLPFGTLTCFPISSDERDNNPNAS